MEVQDRHGVESFLRQRLEEVRKVIAEKEEALEPYRFEEKKLQVAIRDYTSGVFGSKKMLDKEFVEYLRRHAPDSDHALFAPDIAQGMGVDTRGISRRLQRMQREHLIGGDHLNGYYYLGRRAKAAA